MVRKCSVKGCKSESFANCGTSFHGLPNDPERRQLWLSVLPLKKTITANTHICSRHFRKEDYRPYGKPALKNDAVPCPPQKRRPSPSKVPVWPRLLITSSDTNKPIIQTVKSEPDTKIKKIKKCVPVCRVCLATGRKTSDLRDSLRQAYEDVTGVTLTAADSLPQLCWECGARALAAARFRERARRAHRLLAALRPQSGQITALDIASINPKQSGLGSRLSRSHFGPDDYHVHVNEQTVKMETDDNATDLLTELENSNEHDHNYSKCILPEIDADKKEDDYFENDESYLEITNDDDMTDDIYDNHKSDDADESSYEIESTKETMIDNNAKTVKRKRSKKKPKAKPNPDKIKAQEVFKENFAVATLSHEEQVAEILDRKESANYKSATYKCELCYRGFTDKTAYEYHHLKHTDKFGAYECTICKRRQKSVRYQRRHMAAFHSTKYSCKKCVFTTHNRSTAITHIKYHDGVQYQCPHCLKQFFWQSTYYSHMRMKHACAFACALCGHTFISELGLRHHKRTFHLSDESQETLAGPYCETCDVKFVSDAAHAKHLKLSSRHRSDGDVIAMRNDPFATLGVRSGSASDTKESKDAKEARQPIAITCEVCGITCKSSVAYAQHFRWRHPERTPTNDPRRRPATYMCEQCGNKYQNMWLLTEHKRTHTGERKFACACGKTFVKRVNLIAHRHVHDPARRTHPCPVCGKRFGLRSNQLRHMLTHTGLKAFECEACRKRFGCAVQLRAHVSHVHNKRPWPKRSRARARR